MGFLSHVLAKNMQELEMRANKMEIIAAQMEIESSFGGHGYNQLRINNKKENCRNCGANSYKNNKCEYCGTKN